SSGGNNGSTSSSGGANNGSTSSSGGNNGSTSSSGGNNASSSGGGGAINPTKLGGACDPELDQESCGAVATGATCNAAPGDPIGTCIILGCTAGTDDCGGTGTTCQGSGNQTLCIATCDLQTEGGCGPETACVNYQEGPLCTPLAIAECVVDDPNRACGEGQVCQAVGTDGFGQCAAGCDVWTQNCGENQACYPMQNADPSCAPTQGKAEGESCVYINECAAGLLCVNTGAGGSCLPICNEEHACPDARQCQMFNNLPGYGACAAAGG
ncbi:MAG: hypothetical protein AB2A00_43260, partial [Myxococcota bacterium]